MIDYHIIEPEDIEIYTYGLTNGFIIIVNIFTTLLFAYFIKKIDIAIIMLLSFIPLRSFSGGIHCNGCIPGNRISFFRIVIMFIRIINICDPFNFLAGNSRCIIRYFHFKIKVHDSLLSRVNYFSFILPYSPLFSRKIAWFLLKSCGF